MFDLERFFGPLFGGPQISLDELRLFSEDHAGKLVARNEGGLFTAMIATQSAAHSAFYGGIANTDLASAIRKSLTAAKDAVAESFKDVVSRREGRVKDKYGKDTPQYLKFFPLGITEYRDATLEDLPTLLDRMANLAAGAVADLGQDFADEFALFRTNFIAARKAQVDQKGEVSQAKSGTAAARIVLEDVLMDNLLSLAKMFKRKPEMAKAFFSQHLLEEPQSAAEPEDPAPPTP